MRVLHAGCGQEALPDYFGKCEEVRLDANPEENPDIVASIDDLGEIGSFDVVFSSHVLEHLYPHQVPRALKEFMRVAKAAVVIVPDLEGVAINEDVLYTSPVGPITALDLLYGLRSALAENPHMAHHTCFTGESLKAAMLEAGYAEVKIMPMECYGVMAIAK